MGIFKGLFGKKIDLPPADLGVLITDVHSHLIPGIDDGAPDMETSIKLIKELSRLGFKKLVTTPHVMGDHYRNTPEIILGGLNDVRKELESIDLDVEIEAAAEYYLDHSFEPKIKNKELLVFGEKYVLFELPFIAEPASLNNIIFELQMAGYLPVLAHVERYPFWFGKKEKYQELFDKDVVIQLNINSLTGAYGPEVKKAGETLVDMGVVKLLGSDLHHMGHIELLRNARKLPYIHKILEKEDLINKIL